MVDLEDNMLVYMDGAAVFSRRRGLSSCGGQSAGTALMAVACGGRVSLLT